MEVGGYIDQSKLSTEPKLKTQYGSGGEKQEEQEKEKKKEKKENFFFFFFFLYICKTKHKNGSLAFRFYLNASKFWTSFLRAVFTGNANQDMLDLYFSSYNGDVSASFLCGIQSL